MSLPWTITTENTSSQGLNGCYPVFLFPIGWYNIREAHGSPFIKAHNEPLIDRVTLKGGTDDSAGEYL